jgi:hypothetical protein
VVGGFIDPSVVLAAQPSSSRLAKIFHRIVTQVSPESLRDCMANSESTGAKWRDVRF